MPAPIPSTDTVRSATDTPLGALGTLDLSTRPGLALLRRFDAALHRIPDETARQQAVAALNLQFPLACRGDGLMVVPGGALIWRQDDRILACDPATLHVMERQALPALRRALTDLPCRSVVHTAEGLQCFAGLPAAQALQAATILAPGAALGVLGRILPEARHWAGPVLLRWGRDAVLAWEMAPLQGRLALAVSLLAEVLEVDCTLPRHWWDAPSGDDRYQLLSSGLAAHLDEVLGQEVSDTLRFALIAHWTDGDDSPASALADGLALLPACFGSPRDRAVGVQPLFAWPRSQEAMAAETGACALFGISPAEDPAAWSLEARQAFLRTARATLPPGDGLLLAEAGRAAPRPLAELAADRMIRQEEHALGLLQRLMPGTTPLEVLHTARTLVEACGLPVLVVVPHWGLCHRCDPRGSLLQGNAAWFGLAGGVEDLAETL